MNAPGAHALLRAALGGAARRWRNRRLLEGACVAAVGTLALAVLAIALMDGQRFDPGVVSLARTAVYFAAGALVLAFLVARVPWRHDPRALARHLEARDPALDALLLTAVQVHRDGAASTLSHRLFRRAAAACEDPHGATREDRVAPRRAAGWLAAIVAAVALALLLAGPGWRHGALLLALPLADARDGMPYAVQARPGTVTVLENSDLAVHGEARGFAPAAMALLHRAEGEQAWTRTAMDAVDDGFQSLLVGVSAPFEYYLEAQGVRTAAHRVAVQRLPRIEAMQHRYRYPQYTGLGEEVVDDATAITAVSGTQVELRVRPAAAPAAGELVLDGERRRVLARDGDVLTATIGVDEASRYRVELATADGALIAATPEYDVRALEDAAPEVKLVSPGADTRVTPVEELRIEVQAEDDVSLRAVELVLSVNGQPEEVVALDAGAGQRRVRAVHGLYLERRALTPGDVIAVHARASDGTAGRIAVTDLLFMEVRPFDRDYTRGRSGGRQGGGGGGGDSQQGLAAQQRDLVVALFRLARDAARLSEHEQSERLTVLSDAQARIRGRVEAIVRRIQGRAVVQTTPGYQIMLEEMPRAAAAMLRVEALLAVPAPEEALPRAREALAHLQRADAAFREVRVAAQQGGGGGGGRTDDAELSRLFELEMDRFRNRYSQVQRAAPQQRQQQLDETLRKLEELARRQQQEVDRARRRAARSDLAGRGAATQQQLAQELEELLRRLERLTREQSASAMDAARRALEQAAQAMRQAGSPSAAPSQGQTQGQPQGQAQGNARGQSQSQAQGQAPGQPRGQGGAASGTRGAEQAAREALDRLEQAREALTGDGPAQVARALEDARRRAQSLSQRQQRMREQVAQDGPAATAGERDARRGGDGAPPRGAGSSIARDSAARDGAARAGGDASTRADAGDGGARALDADKARMQADAQALREQLDRIAEQAGAAQPEAARRTRSAASIMREEDVEARLGRSREQLAAGVPDQGLENAIARALERVRERVDEAAQAAAQGAGDGDGQRAGAATPEGLRALMRELAGLRERTRDAAAGSAGPGGRDASGLQELAGSLQGLRGQVARNPGATGDLQALIHGIESLAADGAAMAGGPQRDAFLAALAGVERAIARLASDAADRSTLPAGRDARAPERYRALVEDYYRALSTSAEVPSRE